MMTIDLGSVLVYLCAGLGLGCFLWPTIKRIRANEPSAQPMDLRASMQSPFWWAGMVLTAAALYLQRLV
jgi:hypothetical protein